MVIKEGVMSMDGPGGPESAWDCGKAGIVVEGGQQDVQRERERERARGRQVAVHNFYTGQNTH